jgi:hypothetical protein
MDYRDERDALRGRVENLEQDLAAAKQQLHVEGDAGRAARIAEIERQMAEARGFLEKLSDELDALKTPPAGPRLPARQRNGAAMIAMVALACAGGMTIAYGLAVRSLPPARDVPRSPFQPALPSLPGASTITLPRAPPPMVEPMPVPRTVVAAWEGRVTRVTGVPPVAPGRACRVEATLRRAGNQIDVDQLDVQCGGQTIYDSRIPLNGVSMNGAGVVEQTGRSPAGTNVYRLGYQDQGARSGRRNEISLDTDEKSAAVWKTSVPAFRVEIALPKWSTPVVADPLLGPSR